MGWTLRLIREGIDDVNPVGRQAVLFNPEGLLVLLLLPVAPLHLVFLVLGKNYRPISRQRKLNSGVGWQILASTSGKWQGNCRSKWQG